MDEDMLSITLWFFLGFGTLIASDFGHFWCRII
jgi:hypothetical protein